LQIEVQGIMPVATKKRASKQEYQSLTQLTIEGFETPFVEKLDPNNRWVKLAGQIPWDRIVGIYLKQLRNHSTGASSINPRVILGSVMIKHLKNLSDEETILEIQENIYLQYFIGYSSFTTEAPFDPSLFVEIRNRLGSSELGQINEQIVSLYNQGIQTKPEKEPQKAQSNEDSQNEDTNNDSDPDGTRTNSTSLNQEVDASITQSSTDLSHKGRLLIDATACPQDIAYPTDLNLLNNSRIKSEELIDRLYRPDMGFKKPRTYRKEARKNYLRFAQKRQLNSKQIRKAIAVQLRYLRRNLSHIEKLVNDKQIFLKPKEYKYMFVIHEVYRQQLQMWNEGSHSIDHRIVSIHQPHVRPIIRGKSRNKTEFGAKLHLSLVDGFAFVDHLSWEAYNEGTLLVDSIERYKIRHGSYTKEVLADQIYCNRENRRKLKELGIRLLAKPLGRPPAVIPEHVSPGERNPIEGKFGQAKNGYGLDKIRARLSQTSESWIASIVLVLNLVNLARVAPLCLYYQFLIWVRDLRRNQRIELYCFIERGLLFQ
jgi:IS5 family transposase